MEKKTKTISYFINLCFFLYFVILLTERVLSIVLSFTNGVNIFSDAFNGYVYLLTFISLISFLVFTSIKCSNELIAIFKPNKDISFNNLCIASGIILLSGMVHTEYTIPVIQFISYGILILGIFLKVLLNSYEEHNKPLLWLSFVYLVCFSMAIPVMYRSMIDQHILFHIIEAISSVGLVVVFTFLLLQIFKGNNNLFYIFPIIIAVVLDTSLIILRWNEEINWFVLIFISLSLIMFIIGYIISKVRKEHD